MNKKKIQSEQTKKKIIEAAWNLFVRKGYTATSIEDIVALTGSSKGIIYYHFKSKENLFLYLLEEWDRSWLEQWHVIEQQYDTISEKLYAMAEHIVTQDMNHPLTKAADEFFGSKWTDRVVQDRLHNLVLEHVAFNKRLFQKGIESGEFAENDVETLGIIMESLLLGLSEVSRHYDQGRIIDTYRKAVDVFLNGIAVRKVR